MLNESVATGEAAELLASSHVGGRLLNIFRCLAQHPKLLKRWRVFANHVLGKSTLPLREREILILRTGWLCHSAYEFGQHTEIGRDCGLTDEEISRITEGPDAPGWSEDDRLLLLAADELRTEQRISDATWAGLARRWDRQQMMDIVFTVGNYTLVAMALNSFGVPLDAGVPGFPRGRSG
ncbi:carboxymuconolactone decarboxylase family protein [Marinibaculum pumilum]|uniref:Carboxymuconolactone decarboxylase family protein n=1 Tax=Marinibaculum pumilum TaxID=1766165 RepID=A0ABV7KUU2_9PROT